MKRPEPNAIPLALLFIYLFIYLIIPFPTNKNKVNNYIFMLCPDFSGTRREMESYLSLLPPYFPVPNHDQLC
jgi:hypothetical protein